MRRVATLALASVLAAAAYQEGVHYLRWTDVEPVLEAVLAGSGKVLEVKDTSDWDNWIRERDFAIRGRVDHGIEDSISEMIVFGTSFPAPPKISSAASAVNAAGDLTAAANARVAAFVDALDEIDNERFRLILEFLQRRRVTQEELNAFLGGNLRRFAIEQGGLIRKQSRFEVGLPSETSFLTNFAIEDTLRSLKAASKLPANIRRIAVIGPGIDLGGSSEAYDVAPPQSVQPFAVLDTVLRLGAGQLADVKLAALDLNPFVLSHLRTVAGKARAGQACILQLPRTTPSAWNTGAVAYWRRFGDSIGAPATTVTPPAGIELRAISVKPQIAARIAAEDVDIVAQTVEGSPGFDLVVATDLLGYYSHGEQILALTSIARMMAPGGVLLCDGVVPLPKIAPLEDLGSHHTSYTDTDNSGEDLIVLRRR